MRVVGALSISTGTSAAFEGQQLSSVMSSITSYLINLRTLVRNARCAFDENEGMDVDRILLAVCDDITKLAEFLNDSYKGKPIEFILYNPSYTGLPRKFPKADLWEPKSEKQKEIANIESKVIKQVCKRLGGLIRQTDCTLPAFSGNGIILSHHTVDLVLNNSQNRLFLLESYTGNIKPYTKWYTKLTGESDQLFNLPLNKLTIQIFGDKSVNFRSMSKAKKELVRSIALKGKWTTATTESRVRSTINSLANAVDREGLLMLL